MSVSASSSERFCRACGARLSRYNPDILCWSCQEEKRTKATDTRKAASLPSTLPHSNRTAFTLRSIFDTARRTKPVRLSDIGHVLQYYRNLHQLTQRDLAALLGFDQSYISKLENGQGLRDIATLKHIAQSLSLPEPMLGLNSEGSPGIQSSELIEVAPSIIRLSQTVRENGRADAAVNELWPLILRLETQTQNSGNPTLSLILASAQAMLGVILGDLLPEEDLWISVRFFKKAVALVDEYGNAQQKAEVYRGCGNELRKHKQYPEAILYLEQAFFLAPDNIGKGIVAALLARTYGEMGDQEHFLDAMKSVLYVQERADSFISTFNPLTINEVHLRGLVNVGQTDMLSPLLEQEPTRFLTVSVAPQWHVISQLTRAEALFCIHKIDEGLAYLKTALIGAELCRLPHQVQRAIRATQVIQAYSPTPVKAFSDEARLLLEKLSHHNLQLPFPQ